MNEFFEPRTVVQLLKDLRCSWGVAGGWALDVFLGRVTRHHQDIEVAIFREDQLILQEYLASRGWTFEYVRQGKLAPWPAGERLSLPIHEIWCRAAGGPLSRLEVLLNERNGDTFVFRRDPRIGAPLERTFVRARIGIPILAPEIVLLYKSKRADEAKERQDFLNVVHALSTEDRHWLAASLESTDPRHRWLPILNEPNTRASAS